MFIFHIEIASHTKVQAGPQEGDPLVKKLQQVRQEQQTALDQSGPIDSLEEEFTRTVKPLMNSCTKDAIAVSR